jgi:hypothetical protein
MKRILFETIGVDLTGVNLSDSELHIYDGYEFLLEVVDCIDPQLVELLPDTGRNWRAQQDAAAYRQREIAQRIPVATKPTGALVMLPDYSRQNETKLRDPKNAIRLGLLDMGRTSQFVVPRGEREKPDQYKIRCQNAIRDLLRSLGYRLNPVFTAPADLALPAELDLMAFWVVQLNARRLGEATITLPVVIHAPSGHSHFSILLPRPDSSAGVYSTLYEGIRALVALEHEERHFDDEAIRRFFKSALREQITSRATLLMLVEQNLRRVLPELRTQSSQPYFSFDGLLDDLPQVRVARLRYSSDGEAPLCLPAINMGKYQGLYQHSESPGVSYSLHNLGNRHQSASWHRLDRMKDAAVNPCTLQIWLNNLQPADDPESWAALVHRLRLESSHNDIPTNLPQPLHDAQDKLSEYLSRQINPADIEDEDERLFIEAMAQG